MFSTHKDYLIDLDAQERTKKMFMTSVVLEYAAKMAIAQKLAKTSEEYAYNMLKLAAMFGFQQKKIGRITEEEANEIGRCAERLLTFADLKVRTIRFHADAFKVLKSVPDPDLGKVFTRETYRVLCEAIENYKELYGLDNEGNPRRIYADSRGYQDRIDVNLLVKLAGDRHVKAFGFFENVTAVMMTLEPKGRAYFGKNASGSLLQGEAPIIPVKAKDHKDLKKYLAMQNTILCYR